MLRQIAFAPRFPGLPLAVEPVAAAARRLSDRLTERGNPARVAAFEMTDPRVGWGIVNGLRQLPDLRNDRFCEWGAGIGLVTCLASLAGWRARGVELHPALVAEGQALAKSQGIAVDLTVGSYKPAGFFDGPPPADLPTSAPGLCAAAVTFVYCWPAEADSVRRFFERSAPTGAYLLLYRGGVTMDLWRQD